MTGSLASGLLAVIVGVVAVGSTATAQPGTAPTEEIKQRATLLVTEGIRLQGKRDYDGAVGKYKEAYCLIPEPALVYNIGTAYQEAGKNPEAAGYFRMYLKVAPNGDLASDAKSALKAVSPKEPKNAEVATILCETEKPRPVPRPVCIDGAAPVDGECPPVSCAPGLELRAGMCVAIDTSQGGGVVGGGGGGAIEGSKPGRNKLFYIGLGTAGAGAIALGVGIVFGLKAQRLGDELSEHTSGPWTQELLDKEAEGKAAERNQIIFTAIGGAAIAGGAVMVVLGLRSNPPAEESRGVTLQPWFTGDDAGFAVTGRY